MTWNDASRAAFFLTYFAHPCEMEDVMKFLLLVLPVVVVLIHYGVADVLRAIPDRNEDFGGF